MRVDKSGALRSCSGLNLSKPLRRTNLIHRLLKGALVIPGTVGTAVVKSILKLSMAFASSS